MPSNRPYIGPQRLSPCFTTLSQSATHTRYRRANVLGYERWWDQFRSIPVDTSGVPPGSIIRQASVRARLGHRVPALNGDSPSALRALMRAAPASPERGDMRRKVAELGRGPRCRADRCVSVAVWREQGRLTGSRMGPGQPLARRGIGPLHKLSRVREVRR